MTISKTKPLGCTYPDCMCMDSLDCQAVYEPTIRDSNVELCECGVLPAPCGCKTVELESLKGD